MFYVFTVKIGQRNKLDYASDWYTMQCIVQIVRCRSMISHFWSYYIKKWSLFYFILYVLQNEQKTWECLTRDERTIISMVTCFYIWYYSSAALKWQKENYTHVYINRLYYVKSISLDSQIIVSRYGVIILDTGRIQ